MTFEQMLLRGPMHLHRRDNGQYHVAWAPLGKDGETRVNGIGVAWSPYAAMSLARLHAEEQGAQV